MKSTVVFSRASDEWSTPQDFFDRLNAEFQFDVDVAASAANTKCAIFISSEGDALRLPWTCAGDVCWMNPPYSRCREFITKAAQEARQGCTVVCLVPSRTDTRWWHEHVWDACTNRVRPGVEVRFVKGRLKFGGSSNSAPFPSVVVIFRPPESA